MYQQFNIPEGTYQHANSQHETWMRVDQLILCSKLNHLLCLCWCKSSSVDGYHKMSSELFGVFLLVWLCLTIYSEYFVLEYQWMTCFRWTIWNTFWWWPKEVADVCWFHWECWKVHALTLLNNNSKCIKSSEEAKPA